MVTLANVLKLSGEMRRMQLFREHVWEESRGIKFLAFWEWRMEWIGSWLERLLIVDLKRGSSVDCIFQKLI